ncbi:MAG: hypothetical protein JWS12_226 [Candidatus Saccharibacteria bacterium]|nr:hypothetical protein [Candidatus Saccharibacteria bacterium]
MNPQNQTNDQPAVVADFSADSGVPAGNTGPQLFVSSSQASESKGNKGKRLFIIGLVVLIVAGIGGGFWLTHKKAPTKSATKTTPTSKASTPPVTAQAAPAVDPYASWKSYSNALGKFSLKYPSSWLIVGCFGEPPESSIKISLADSKDYLGVCPDFKNKPEQISIGYGTVNNPASDTPIPGIEVSTATVGGKTAKKLVSTYTTSQANRAVKNINYLVRINTTNYTFSYTVYKDSAGKLLDANFNDFTAMVEKTVKFQ